MAANGHGGHRTPSKPAAVSGPGAHSQRTDGGVKMMAMPDAQYGEQASFHEAQAGAPMNGPSTPSAPAPGGGGGPAPSITPLDAPSARPDEPVTHGAALGAGVGPEALGLDQQSENDADLEKLRPYLPVLVFQANRPEATQAFKNYVRQIKAALK